MARRWLLFLRSVQFLLKAVLRLAHSRSLGIWLTVTGLFFLGCLTPVVLPVAAQFQTTPLVVHSSTNIPQLVQRGREFYKSGQFTEAVKVWQQAASALKSSGGNVYMLAMVFSNLSQAYQQLGSYFEAKEALDKSRQLLPIPSPRNSKEDSFYIALVLNTQGSLQLALGQAEKALDTWKQAEAAYKQAGDEKGVTRALINQAQALEVLGFNRRALQILEEVHQTLQKQPDLELKAIGLRSYGDALQAVGNLKESQEVLQESLKITKPPQDMSAIYLSLGNTAKAASNKKDALLFYEKASDKSASPLIKIKAQLNYLSLLLEIEPSTLENIENLRRNHGKKLNSEDQKNLDEVLRTLNTAQDFWPQIFTQIEQLPPSQTVVYARINLAQSLLKLSDSLKKVSIFSPESLVLHPQALELLLTTALEQAKSLGDKSSSAYALGYLGQLYEKTGQIHKAQDLTHQALEAAQTINAPDIAYQWQWQQGRLLKKQKDTEGAIAAYTIAVENLKALRSALVATSRDIQFSFQESVEPVYREFVELLLESDSHKPDEKKLKQARETIEALQLAELDNFFRQACLDAHSINVDEVLTQKSTKTAVIYPIILEDRLEVIVTLPKQPLQHYTTSVARHEVENVLKQLRSDLEVEKFDEEIQPDLQKVYNWLILPAEPSLKKNGIKTLVFVLDGSLRNIPMAALYDGKQYLIDRYAVALTPGLNIFEPKQLSRGQPRVLFAGLSNVKNSNIPRDFLEKYGFDNLPGIESELKLIKAEVPHIRELVNQKFNKTALAREVKNNPFQILHLATHGNFGSTPQDTFILASGSPINIDEIKDLLQARDISSPEALELLILSACKTAQGDPKAALGIAGVAVKAGARSTVASLWSLSDAESTGTLIKDFYHQLLQHKTKAEALQHAQKHLLTTTKPYFWAPFVLLGNWL